MKGKTIMGLILTVGLLLIGTVAFATWNDYGYQVDYGTGHGYGCGYGRMHGDGYKVQVNYPCGSCYGYRHGGRDWNTYDRRHNYDYGWTGYGDHRRMGPRGCW